jgi:hypothetical protein
MLGLGVGGDVPAGVRSLLERREERRLGGTGALDGDGTGLRPAQKNTRGSVR